MHVCLLQAKALFSFEKHLPTDAPTSPLHHLTCTSRARHWYRLYNWRFLRLRCLT